MKDAAALYAQDDTRTAVPDALPMGVFQTVCSGSPSYKAGWNACRKAMLSAAKEEL